MNEKSNKSINKPLRYNRFRAYLRIKLRNKHFNKRRIYLIIAIYIILSLSIFLLPNNILTKYPYLTHFTNFMDFIPAIKQMEVKTFAPEMCKFYASYMFVIAFICLICSLREMVIIMLISRLRYNKYTKYSKKIFEKIKSKPILEILLIIACNLAYIFYILDFLSGDSVGYLRMRNIDEYFVYSLFEMWYYTIREVGFMFVVGTNFVALANILYFDIFMSSIKKVNNEQ